MSDHPCRPCARCGEIDADAGSRVCVFCADETAEQTVRRYVADADAMREHIAHLEAEVAHRARALEWLADRVCRDVGGRFRALGPTPIVRTALAATVREARDE